MAMPTFSSASATTISVPAASSGWIFAAAAVSRCSRRAQIAQISAIERRAVPPQRIAERQMLRVLTIVERAPQIGEHALAIVEQVNGERTLRPGHPRARAV